MTPRPRTLVLFAVFAALPATSRAQAGGGSVSCQVTENGEPGAGSIVISRDGTEVARGDCGKPIAVPAGSHTAVLALDGALDGPQRTQPVAVTAGATSHVSADFATGTIEVRIQSEGRRAAGMAIIRKNGVQVGTLGSGVSAHVSAGSYEVVARYRAKEKVFAAVAILKGAHVVLDATF
jgi:hypothetical protein